MIVGQHPKYFSPVRSENGVLEVLTFLVPVFKMKKGGIYGK